MLIESISHIIYSVTHGAGSGRSVSSTSTRCWSSFCSTLGFGSLSALNLELSPIRCLPQGDSGQDKAERQDDSASLCVRPRGQTLHRRMVMDANASFQSSACASPRTHLASR